MKKRILIFCGILLTMSLTAFTIINWNGQVESSSDKSIVSNIQGELDYNLKVSTDFFYSIDTRFGAIKKSDIDKAKSISAFLSEDQVQKIVSYKSVKITILEDSKHTDISETGHSSDLTAAQIKLLQSTNYSTNILIRADYLESNKINSTLNDSYATPHLTIVPEKQAIYISGKDVLIDYFKENSIEETSIAQNDKLQPAKLYFTITKKGLISNVKLVISSGYPSIDNRMMELIINAPGKWEPAKNSKGENVDQELVFFYGLLGC